MSLYKRGGTYWCYLYRDGVRHAFSTGTGNRKEAQKIEDKKKQELNDARFQIVSYDPEITVGALAAQFVASGSARKHHIYHLRFLLGFFAEMPALRVTKALAEEYRKKRKQFNPQIKDATVNRDLSVLRHLLYWAVDELLIAANPLARLKMPQERRIRRQILSIAEESALLETAKGHLHTMIVMALDTGMRRGEIANQKWQDIDFAQKILSVSVSKTPGGESREIPLTERLYALLAECRKNSGYVIQFEHQPVHIVKTSWKTALKRANVRHLRFHDLRHTFNTRMMEAGVLQEVRMAIMGHSPAAKIHATYTHIELPTKRKAIRKLEEWVKEQQQELFKENEHASTEERSEVTAVGETRPQTMEKEVARRSGVGTGRQAEIRDRRDGGGVESQTSAAPEIRRGAKVVRIRVERNEEAV